MSSTLQVQIEDHVQIITLNRPDKKNAFNKEMIDAWVNALEHAQQDDNVHVVVLTGAGDAFCSGGDTGNISKSSSTPLDSKYNLGENVHRVALQLKRMDKPVIAAINGSAVGAGLDMALMADIRTMAETAKVSEGYVKFGLVPGNGGAYFLPRIIGESKAYELLWTGNFIDAQEALRIGLVNHVYPQETFMEQTMDLAKQIASGPQVAIRMTKRAVRDSKNLSLESSLDLISSHMAIVKETEDHKEAVKSFREKRKPNYTCR